MPLHRPSSVSLSRRPSQGSVPTIRDVPLEEVCRVLFRTPGGDRRVRRRAPEAELAG